MKRKARSRKSQQVEEEDNENADSNRNTNKGSSRNEKDNAYTVMSFMATKNRPIIPKSVFIDSVTISTKSGEESQSKKAKVNSVKLNNIIEDDVIQNNRKNVKNILNNRNRKQDFSKTANSSYISYTSTKDNPIRYTFSDSVTYKEIFQRWDR